MFKSYVYIKDLLSVRVVTRIHTANLSYVNGGWLQGGRRHVCYPTEGSLGRLDKSPASRVDQDTTKYRSYKCSVKHSSTKPDQPSPYLCRHSNKHGDDATAFSLFTGDTLRSIYVFIAAYYAQTYHTTLSMCVVF